MARRTISYTIVDAFTSEPFKGNPASVVLLAEPLPDETLQLVAKEFNLAETAFLTPQPEKTTEKSLTFGLRWFTPTVEVSLCGHATLASSKILFTTDSLVSPAITQLRFETKSGILTAQKLDDGRIELEFPGSSATPSAPELEAKVKHAVAEALGSDVKVASVHVGTKGNFQKFIIVEIESSTDLEGLSVKPAAFDIEDTFLVAVTKASTTQGLKFESRVFAPQAGIPEDPVTGAAHCLLGPYWASKYQANATQELPAKQVSPRGGYIGVVWDKEAETCKLRGNACIVAKGEMFI